MSILAQDEHPVHLVPPDLTDPFEPGFVNFPDEAPELPPGADFDPVEDLDWDRDREWEWEAGVFEARARMESGHLF